MEEQERRTVYDAVWEARQEAMSYVADGDNLMILAVSAIYNGVFDKLAAAIGPDDRKERKG